MDIDQSARKKAKDYFNVIDPDFYEIECKINLIHFLIQKTQISNRFFKHIYSLTMHLKRTTKEIRQ